MMKNKSGWMYRANTVLVSLLVAMLVTSCAAMPVDVAPVVEAAPAVVAEVARIGASVGTMEMLQGMGQAMQEGTGAFMMQQGEQLFMAWPKGNAWEFVFLSTNGAPVNGIKLDVWNFSDLVKQLEGSGWQYVSPETASTLLPAALANVLMFGANAMPSIFVLPAFMLPEELVPVVEEIPT